jgi:hypothetical protein
MASPQITLSGNSVLAGNELPNSIFDLQNQLGIISPKGLSLQPGRPTQHLSFLFPADNLANRDFLGIEYQLNVKVKL